MGLLDGLLGGSMEDPRTAATLQLAQGLLGGGGSMQRLAGGMQGYGSVMAQARAQEEEKRRRMLQEQMLMQQLEAAKAQQAERAAAQAKEKAIDAAYQGAFRSGDQRAMAAYGGPTMRAAEAAPNLPGQIDQQALIRNLMQADPRMAAQMAMPKPQELMSVAPGAAVIDKANPTKALFTAPKEDTTPADFKLYQLSGAQARGIDFDTWDNTRRRASASQQNVTVGAEKAFSTELAKLDAKQLDAMRDAAEKSRAAIGVVQNLRAADAQGAYSGGFADQKLAGARLINGLTGATPKGLVGSELYNAEASKLVVETIKQLGANPSNADLQFIQRTIPQLSTSPVARKAMADFMEAKANGTISVYKKANAFARTNNGLSGFEGVPDASGGEWSITPVPGR